MNRTASGFNLFGNNYEIWGYTYIPYIIAVPLTGMQLSKIFVYVHKELYTGIFTASLSIRGKRNLKPSSREVLNKL